MSAPKLLGLLVQLKAVAFIKAFPNGRRFGEIQRPEERRLCQGG